MTTVPYRHFRQNNPLTSYPSGFPAGTSGGLQGPVCTTGRFRRENSDIKWLHFNPITLPPSPELPGELRWSAHPNLNTSSFFFSVVFFKPNKSSDQTLDWPTLCVLRNMEEQDPHVLRMFSSFTNKTIIHQAKHDKADLYSELNSPTWRGRRGEKLVNDDPSRPPKVSNSSNRTHYRATKTKARISGADDRSRTLATASAGT